MTDAERRLWSRLRGKKMLGLQFYRQKPIGNYIVDFYCPTAKLVVEVDGAQYFEIETFDKDQTRTVFLQTLELMVIRFDNHQILTQLDDVVTEIYRVVERQIPPSPSFDRLRTGSFSKGGENS